MDGYMEQSVPGKRSSRTQLLYALCWGMMILLSVVALICAAGILGSSRAGQIQIHWFNLVVLVLCLLLVGLIWRCKDRLYVEYDYLFQNDVLEIWVIYNQRRRRQAGRISMEQVRSVETSRRGFSLSPDEEKREWYVQPSNLTCIHFMEGNNRRAALLELNEDMLKCIKGSRRLDRSVWRDGEGKFYTNGSLS